MLNKSSTGKGNYTWSGLVASTQEKEEYSTWGRISRGTSPDVTAETLDETPRRERKRKDLSFIMEKRLRS